MKKIWENTKRGWGSLNEFSRAKWGLLKDRCRANPGRAAAVGAVLLLAVASAIALSWCATRRWRIYVIEPVGMTLDLPTAPQAVSEQYDSGAVVYEARAPELAVVMALFESKTGAAPDRGQLIARVMTYLSRKPELENLRYQVTRGRAPTPPSWRVSGTFRRGGMHGRVVGRFTAGGEKTWQVLCFFSDVDGGRMAGRILRSVEYHSEGGR